MSATPDRRKALLFIKGASLAALLLVLAQLLLGGDPLVVLLCLASCSICLVPVYLYGLERTGGMIYVIIWFTFAFFALVLKTALLQPVDSNLYNPLLTHMIILVGSIAFSCAGILAYVVRKIHRSYLPPILNPNALTILAVIFLVIGGVGEVIGLQSTSQSVNSPLPSYLQPYFLYSYVCATAAVIIKSGGRRTLSWLSLIVGGLFLAISFSYGTKQGLLSIPAIYILCAYAFRVRLKWITYVVLFSGAVFFSNYLFPAIHIVRSQISQSNVLLKAEATLDTTINLIIGDSQTVEEAERQASAEVSNAGGYDFYRNLYFGDREVWLDRFTITGFVDAVGRRISFDGPFFGAKFILDQTAEVLPQQLNPNKAEMTRLSGGDKITHALGISSDRDHSLNPTVPLPVELFIGGGFPLILAVGIPLIFLFMEGFNLLAFDFMDNIWSVCFLIGYGFFFYANGYSNDLFLIFRKMPVDFLIMTGSIFLARIVARSSVFGGGRAVLARGGMSLQRSK